MAVQQNKVSKSRRNNRRAHDALVAANPNECSNCGELKRPHHVCVACGHYAEREMPATTVAGPLSPPMASTDMMIRSGAVPDVWPEMS